MVFFIPQGTGIQDTSIQSGIKTDQLAAGDTIRVGFLSSQTGGLSQYSPAFVNAAMLAGAHLNKTTNYDWIINVYDTQTTEPGSTAAMMQAVDDGSAFVVGAAGSLMTLTASPIAKAEQVPLISYSSSSAEITTFDDDGYVFRVVMSDAIQGRVLVKIASYAQFQSATILYEDTDYQIATVNEFETAFNNSGGQVLANESHSFGKTNFSAEIAQIEQQQPDMIFLATGKAQADAFFSQLNQTDMEIPILASDWVFSDFTRYDIQDTREEINGSVVLREHDVVTNVTKAFNQSYQETYPGEEGLFIEEVYDSVFAGAYATMNANSMIGSDIISQLSILNFTVASGQIKFDGNGDLSGGALDIFYANGTDGFVEVGSWINGDLNLTIFGPEEEPLSDNPADNLSDTSDLTNPTPPNSTPPVSTPPSLLSYPLIIPGMILMVVISTIRRKY